MNNFTYYNQTRYVFGHGEYNNIGTLLQGKCKKLLLHYGGGSIKRSGPHDIVSGGHSGIFSITYVIMSKI